MAHPTDAAAVAAIAQQAHGLGDSITATALFRAILRHYPIAPEATDARVYLATHGRRFEAPAADSRFDNRT